MQLLKDMILQVGRVEGEGVLKVDSFLNHQLDIELLNEIGKAFKEAFKDAAITKILTAEVSGIAIAAIAAQYFKVPVVFAKKTQSKNLDNETFEGEVYSYTKAQTYKIRVSKRYLSSEDKVLVLDDFLANGQAALGLKQIVDAAGAELVGIGVVIEKAFQEGGKLLRKDNIRVEALAIIEAMEEGKIIFK